MNPEDAWKKEALSRLETATDKAAKFRTGSELLLKSLSTEARPEVRKALESLDPPRKRGVAVRLFTAGSRLLMGATEKTLLLCMSPQRLSELKGTMLLLPVLACLRLCSLGASLKGWIARKGSPSTPLSTKPGSVD